MPIGHANRLLPSLRRVVLVRHAADLSDGQLLTAFVTEKDGDAFAALVRRHGAMVLGVCRRVVGDAHTAEDAFQAVFLVLARRAAAVRPREQVGNWLYGVAFRTALRARSVLARRRSREKQVETMPEPLAPASALDIWSDLQPVLDDELARLPDKLRLPVVLCDLEGRPQREVARQLKMPPATLATRLASARRTLAARLTKRGITLSGGALAGVLSSHAGAMAVSGRLADGVVHAAEAVAAGEAVAALVSSQAVQLSEGVMRMMLVTKLKAVGVAILTTVGLTTGLGVGLAPARGDDAPTTKPATAKAPESDAAYLNRLCKELRGTPATIVEKVFFGADADSNKRRKVVDWLLSDENVKAYLAKKHGDTPRVELVDPTVLAFDVSSSMLEAQTGTFLFDAAVNNYAGLNGTIVTNEKNYNVIRRQRTTPPANILLGDTAKYAATVSEVYSDDVTGPTAWFFRLLPDGQSGQSSIATWSNVYNPVEVQYFLNAQPAQGEKTVTLQGVTNDLNRVTIWASQPAESDADFLKRVVKDARGTTPTALEEKYFAEDKDAKKREKLLDALLKDPTVAKKLGDDWKKKMLAAPPQAATYTYRTVARPVYEVTQPYRIQLVHQPDRLDKLIGELIDAKKTDTEILSALTLAIVGRQPADGEKLAIAAVAKATDRKAAWSEIIKALAATDEAKKYAADLTKRIPETKKR